VWCDGERWHNGEVMWRGEKWGEGKGGNKLCQLLLPFVAELMAIAKSAEYDGKNLY